MHSIICPKSVSILLGERDFWDFVSSEVNVGHVLGKQVVNIFYILHLSNALYSSTGKQRRTHLHPVFEMQFSTQHLPVT